MWWLFVAALAGAVFLFAMAGWADMEERHRKNGGAPKPV